MVVRGARPAAGCSEMLFALVEPTRTTGTVGTSFVGPGPPPWRAAPVRTEGDSVRGLRTIGRLFAVAASGLLMSVVVMGSPAHASRPVKYGLRGVTGRYRALLQPAAGRLADGQIR